MVREDTHYNLVDHKGNKITLSEIEKKSPALAKLTEAFGEILCRDLLSTNDFTLQLNVKGPYEFKVIKKNPHLKSHWPDETVERNITKAFTFLNKARPLSSSVVVKAKDFIFSARSLGDLATFLEEVVETRQLVPFSPSDVLRVTMEGDPSRASRNIPGEAFMDAQLRVHYPDVVITTSNRQGWVDKFCNDTAYVGWEMKELRKDLQNVRS